MSVQVMIEKLIDKQKMDNRATNHIVMNEYLYIRFKGEMQVYLPAIYKGEDIKSYRGIPIIRLDITSTKDTLLVG